MTAYDNMVIQRRKGMDDTITNQLIVDVQWVFSAVSSSFIFAFAVSRLRHYIDTPEALRY